MRWLWQHGFRWATSRVVDEAKRAATREFMGGNEEEDEGADDEHEERSGSPPAAVALLCETKFLFDAVTDVLSGKRHFEANRLAICTGRIGSKAVVVVRPLREEFDARNVVTATIDGHHPRFAVTLSEATALNTEITPAVIVMATRVVDGEGHSLRIDGGSPTGSGLTRGSVRHAGGSQGGELTDPANAPLAEDTWSLPLARACGEAALPLMVAAVVMKPPKELQSKETAALKHQKSLAGKTGVLAGMLWKKRSGLRDLWNENEARWNAATRVGELAKRLVEAAG